MADGRRIVKYTSGLEGNENPLGDTKKHVRDGVTGSGHPKPLFTTAVEQGHGVGQSSGHSLRVGPKFVL